MSIFIFSLGIAKVQFLADHFLYKFFCATLFAHCARATPRDTNVGCGTACTDNKCLSLQEFAYHSSPQGWQLLFWDVYLH